MSTPPVNFSEPSPPEGLIDACIAGECVLFAGAGLSKRAGFPTWSDFVTRLLEWATENQFVSNDWASSSRSSIERGYAGAVADGIVEALQGNQKALNDFLSGIFLRRARLSTAHMRLRQIPLSAALTTNFDTLLEQTFSAQKPHVYAPGNTPELLEALHKREFFVLKLYGDLRNPNTLMISPTQFEDATSENLPFSQFIETLFLAKNLMFIGASLEGIEDYLKGIGLKKQRTPREHWALVAVKDDSSWQARAESLKRRYGIQIIPYRADSKHTAVVHFLRKLKQRVRGSSELDKESVTQLNRLKLENVGPFKSLDLKLDPRWNIILGDNGVGKSNILRAIAAAICGTDAKAYAGPLIRGDATRAEIVLETDRNVYKTELLKTSEGGAQMEVIPMRPLDGEGWLAIGFPALRANSWDRPSGPQQIARGIPTSDDLLPLIKAEPDARFNQLKQWIVNIDYNVKDEQSRTGSLGPYGTLLKKFFEYLARLTGNVTLEWGGVNPQTYEISVVTDDGVLPIEGVSQGMTSLIGWVGLLLQRFYEVYGDDQDPTQRFALILIDEIDAHLHPAWQQTLVANLSQLFPNAQFIATTHSPLIVGGLPPEQVIRLARDEEGRVVQVNVEQAMTVGRADQILTGELFGLKTTLALNEETQEDLNNYKVLLGKSNRTAREEKTFQELRRRLHASMPMSGETVAERAKQTQEKEELLRQAQAVSKEAESRPPRLGDKNFDSARRLARLLISEIKLYNAQKVEEGRANNDLYDRLREYIDRSREMYDKRVKPEVAAQHDFFHEEVVNALAEGDPRKLGPNYNRSPLQAKVEEQSFADARRFARLLISEIKLYNESRIARGLASDDLYDRLREYIDRSREMYDKRVKPEVAAQRDFFHEELVNMLAEGDSRKLGPNYPGSKAPPESDEKSFADAKRFARLLIAEINIYHGSKIQEGRSQNDLYDRLREYIDNAREMYDKRAKPEVAARHDYFHEELVNTIAEGDPSKLGPNYTRSLKPSDPLPTVT